MRFIKIYKFTYMKEKRMRKLKKMAFMVTAIGMMLSTKSATETNADVVATATIPTVSSVAEAESANAINSTKVILNENKRDDEYCVQVTLNTDSYLLISGGHSDANSPEAEEKISSEMTIYTNSSCTVSKASSKWGYPGSNASKMSGYFFSKGTYYVKVTSRSNHKYTSYEGNVNINLVAIPVSKIFKVKQTVSKNKKYVTVSLPDVLGTYTNYVQYTGGSIGLGSVRDKSIWQYDRMANIEKLHGGKEDTVRLTNNGSGYSFKVTKNGKYTIMIDANGDNRYSMVINVKGIDKKKPVIKGVKNNKKYKKAVTIKFSDKDSGIKSAKLNGKKIKSGKKVKKAGKYKLVVTDKAGNKKTITFWIKKK